VRPHLLAPLLAGCLALAILHPLSAASPFRHGLSFYVTQPLTPRNLYQLTDQLKLRPPRPIPHVVRRTPPNDAIGAQETFWVLSDDQNTYFKMNATIRARTPHLVMYVQNGLSYNPSALLAAAQHFERSTYPTDRSFFGSEWRPGVDDDVHIVCLIGNLRSSSAAGFFSSEDEYPRVVNPYSNQHEMIYMNSAATMPGNSDFNQIMAHEFQHMIHWHMHSRDNAWLNEGMSMLAEYLNHYPADYEAQSFLAAPTTQLNSWSLNDASTIPHYGGAYLYLMYVYQHFGRAVIHDIVADHKYTDFELINDVLRRHHLPITARQIFAHWAVANEIDDRGLAHGIYAYAGLPSTVSQHVSREVPFSETQSIPSWAAQYTVVKHLGGIVHLRFSAPVTVPIVTFPGEDGGWWTNRGDMIQTSLQRTVDLRHVRHATLHFRTMYDIETNYDYAYVEVSRDGGKTWTTLRGTETTTSNPNGENFGNGYTGQSKRWRNETVSLTRYAGRSVLLRFQYVTDDEYNGQGMVIKNITIPEIHWSDDGSGWQANGFVPTLSGRVPLRWDVQLVEYGARGPHVVPMPVAGARGSMTLNTAGLTKLVVVAFSSAPKTTARSAYTLSVTP